MRADEARVGKRVVVRWPLRRADCLGMGGTIAGVWGGNHRHVALDVLLEDGERCLFWHHELEEAAPGPAGLRPSSEPRERDRRGHARVAKQGTGEAEQAAFGDRGR